MRPRLGVLHWILLYLGSGLLAQWIGAATGSPFLAVLPPLGLLAYWLYWRRLPRAPGGN